MSWWMRVGGPSRTGRNEPAIVKSASAARRYAAAPVPNYSPTASAVRKPPTGGPMNWFIDSSTA